AGRRRPLPADLDGDLALLVPILDLQLDLQVARGHQVQGPLTRFETDLAPLETLAERGEVLRRFLARSDPCEPEAIFSHQSSSSVLTFGCFHATAISILALPCFSLASISSARSPCGNTAMLSSPIDSESDPARRPSAMRF